MHNPAAPGHLLSWFYPRLRSLGWWGFALNRVTALGLTLYLFLHLVMLGKLAQGEASYDSFVAFAEQPLVKAGEMLVIAGGLIHGLNGIRVALTSFTIGATRQRVLFIALMALALAGIAYFIYKLFFFGA